MAPVFPRAGAFRPRLTRFVAVAVIAKRFALQPDTHAPARGPRAVLSHRPRALVTVGVLLALADRADGVASRPGGRRADGCEHGGHTRRRSRAPLRPQRLVADRSRNNIVLRWSRARGAVRYLVYVDGRRRAGTIRARATITRLECGTRHRFAVVALAASGRRSATARITASTTRCSAPSRRGPLARAAADTAAPVVSLSLPEHGSSLLVPSVTFAGLTGGLAGDSALITVRLYAGSGCRARCCRRSRRRGCRGTGSRSLRRRWRPGPTRRVPSRATMRATPATARRRRSRSLPRRRRWWWWRRRCHGARGVVERAAGVLERYHADVLRNGRRRER